MQLPQEVMIVVVNYWIKRRRDDSGIVSGLRVYDMSRTTAVCERVRVNNISLSLLEDVVSTLGQESQQVL